MNLENLKKYARKFLPRITQNVVDDTELTFLLNESALQVAIDTKCLSKIIYFNVEKDKKSYKFYEINNNLLGIDDGGLSINVGNGYNEIKPKSLGYVRDNRRNWINNSSSTVPSIYWILDNSIYIDPACNADYSNGFLLYGYFKPDDMANNNDYPFKDGNNELVNLRILSWSILDYFKVLGSQILNDGIEKTNYYYEVYKQNVNKRINIIQSRPDILTHRDSKIGYII